MPALQSIRSEYSKAAAELQSKTIGSQDACEEIDMTISALKENMVDHEAKIHRLEDAYKREREVIDRAAAARLKDCDALETALFEARDISAEERRIALSTQALAELRIRKEQQDEDHAKVKREMTEAIMEAATLCVHHREHVKERIRDIRSAYQQKLESYLLGRQFRTSKAAVVSPIPRSKRSAARAMFDDENVEDHVSENVNM